MKFALAVAGTVLLAASVVSVPTSLRGLEEKVEEEGLDMSGPPPDLGEVKEDEEFLVEPEGDTKSNLDEHHRALAAPKTQTVKDDDPGGYDSSNFPSSFSRSPGLSGFYFDFLTSPRPVKRIRVRPSTSRVDVAYYDYNKDDDFYWKVKATELPSGTGYYYTSGYAHGCLTTPNLRWASGKVPVLRSFDLEFNANSGSNRPLEQVQVRLFMNGPYVRLTVCFNDMNNDDRFRYYVEYALVDAAKVAYNGYSTGLQTDFGGYAVHPAHYNNNYYGQVLSGFNLRFKYSNRNMDRVGIWMSGSSCFGYFDDNNDDDDYEWNVWYQLVRT